MSSALLAASVLPIISLVFFVALFVGVLVWLVWSGRSGRWSRDARIPFDDSASDPNSDRARPQEKQDRE